MAARVQGEAHAVLAEWSEGCGEFLQAGFDLSSVEGAVEVLAGEAQAVEVEGEERVGGVPEEGLDEIEGRLGAGKEGGLEATLGVLGRGV